MKLKKLVIASLVATTIASSMPLGTSPMVSKAMTYDLTMNIDEDSLADEPYEDTIHAQYLEDRAKVCSTAWAKAESDAKMTNAKALTMTVTKADTATAKKLHKELINGRKITLKIKGNKTNAKKIIKSLRNKIKKVNKVGVIFQYDSIKTSNGVTSVVIKKATSKDYNYACAFFKKLWTVAKLENAYHVAKANEFSEYGDYFSSYTTDKKRLFDLVTNTENFCDLSDIVKVFVLFDSGFFDSQDYDYRSNTDFCVYDVVTQEDKEKYGLSGAVTLKNLLYNKYAIEFYTVNLGVIQVLVQYLGVEKPKNFSYTPDNLTSYFTIIQAKNSDGILITAVVGKLDNDPYLVVNNGSKFSTWYENPSLEQERWDAYRKLATYMPKTPTWHLKNFY
jgi:hypothetical protein